MSRPVSLKLYTREQCHLCEEAKATIQSVAAEIDRPVSIEEIDVDSEQRLQEAYGERVPYVFVEGWPAFKYRIDETELRRQLQEA